MNDEQAYKFALNAAYQGKKEGGIPIGAALVVGNNVIATGYNRRVQNNSSIHHGETNCIENAGRLSSKYILNQPCIPLFLHVQCVLEQYFYIRFPKL